MGEKTRLFADSNFLIALYNPHDTLFQKAAKLANQIKKEDIQLVFSSYIFLETVTVLSQRVNRKTATVAGKTLLEDPRFEYLYMDQSLQERTWVIFQEIKSKNISFVDCSILACLEYEDIDKLVTFDQKDFLPLQKAYRFKLYCK